MAITAAMQTQINQLYVALFGRAPDSDGLGYWVGQIDTGMKTLAQVAQDMYNTTPARTYYPSWYTDEQIVTAFYTNVLGRSPDAEGLAYWAGQLESKTEGEVIRDMIVAVVNNTSTDETAVTSQQLFNNKVDVAEYFSMTLRSNDLTLATAAFNNVTTAASSVLSVQSALAASNSAAQSEGTSFTLTTSADDFTGSANNDVFVAAAGRLGTDDNLNGGAGTDVLSAALNSADVAPVISNIEVLNFEFRDASGSIDLADVAGYTAIQIAGNTNGAISSLGDAAKLTLNAYDDTVAISLDTGAASTANSITITIGGSSSGAFDISSAVTVETMNLVMAQSAYRNTAGVLDFGSALTALNVSGSGNFTLVASGLAAAADTLKTINASGLAGNLSITFDTTNLATAQNVVGGSGDDSFNFSATYASNDTVDGGAGADSLTFVINSTSTTRPQLSNVETLNVDFNSAGTFDGRSAAGITTLNVDIDDAAGAFTRLVGVTAINVKTANDSTDNLSVTFQTGSTMDVTLGLGLTTTATDGFSAGDITFAGSTGGVTIAAVGSGGVQIASGTFDDANSLTVNATANSFTATNLQANTAGSVTFNIGKASEVNGTAGFAAATTLNVNLAGTAGAFSAAQLSAAKLATWNISAAGLSATTFGFACAALQGSALDTITVASDGTGAISLGTINVLGNTAADFDVNLSAAGGTVSANFVMSTANPSGGTYGIDVTLSGGAEFNIDFTRGAASTNSYSGALVLNATGVTTAGKVSATWTAFDAGSASIEASFGGGNDYFVAGGGADTIDGGAGNDTLNGGAGADSITGGAGNDSITGGTGNDTIIAGAGANTIVIGTGTEGVETIELVADTAATAADTIVYFGSGNGSAAASDSSANTLGTDTVLFARSGDSIRFYGVLSAGASSINVFSGHTGAGNMFAGQASGFYTAALSTAGLDVSSSRAQFAIVSNGADTVIEVVVSTAGNVSGAGIQKVILEGITLGTYSSQFKLDTDATGSALFITLIS